MRACVCVYVVHTHTHTHTDTHFGISVAASVAMPTYVDETFLAGKKKYKLGRNWPGCEESDCRYVHWLPVERDSVEGTVEEAG